MADLENRNESPEASETSRLTEAVQPSPLRKPLDPDWREQLKKKAVLGPLSDNFLRIPTATVSPASGADLQQVPFASTTTRTHPHAPSFHQYAGRLAITLAQCRLNKNYGLTRMDPYCRLSIGHGVYETPTDLNGAKNPKWNKCIYITLPTGIMNFYVEIFDEKAFTVDERIAWSHIEIPAAVFEGQQVEDWFPLNGTLGEGKEGTMLLGFKFEPMANQGSPQGPQPHVVYQPGNMPVNAQQQRTSLQSQVSKEGFQQLKDMFPGFEEEVIASVLISQGNNTDKTINALLAMTNS